MTASQEQVVRAIERRRTAATARTGEVIGVESIDSSTTVDDFHVDASRITAQSQEKLDNATSEQIAVLTEISSTDTIFITLFDMPNEHSWSDSAIKTFLYERGITADSIDDILGEELPIDTE